MIYDRLGRLILPGSLVIRVMSGSLCVVLNVIQYAHGVEVSYKMIETSRHAPSFRRLMLLCGGNGEWLQVVEVIRHVSYPRLPF